MGRKGKKSKKQLEDELQRAAEEQKRHEEKERLLKLEEDTLAQHRARLEEELDSKQKVLEAERLDEESSIVARMKGERRQNLEYEQAKLQDRINWQKFVSCMSRPNVAFENEITTYMTLVREDPPIEIDDSLEKCRQSEEIVGDLLELYCKAKEEGDTARQEWCMSYIYRIRDMELEQIDEATAYLLQYIEKKESNANSQVFLQWGQQTDEIKVGFWGHLQSKGFRAKQIDHPKLQITLDLPKAIAQQSIGNFIGVRSLYTTYDSANGRDPSQMSVGGMIRVDLLSIPPFSKKVKGWTIRQMPAEGQELMKLPYPCQEQTTAAGIASQPCKIEYKVPSHVLVGRNPTISFWDDLQEGSEGKWSTEGIADISWEPDSRKISFWSACLAAFSITQPRHLDLPYQHWSMRPVAPLLAELKIQAARYELHFLISEDGLRLKGPDLPELQQVMYASPAEANNPEAPGTGPVQPSPGGGHKAPRIRSPATLLRELRDCGLNLMPEDGDAEYLDGYTPKCPETQARAYSDLSELAGYYDIASSQHNKSLPKERALVRIRDNPLFEEFDPLDPDCDTDYTSVLFFPDKSCFVQSLERSCSQAMKPGHVTHASLYLCFEKVPEPQPANQADLLSRLEVTCSSARFVEAVRQTMQLMRLLCFV